MVSNLFYKSRIHQIGGIETFLWNIAQKYRDRDILVVYCHGDEDQIRRLRKHVRVKKFDGNPICCKRAFLTYDWDAADYIHAEEYIMMIHGDYKALGITPPKYPQITGYLGVSEQVCRSFRELCSRPIELAYNPLVVQKPRKMLNLITTSRLTQEKGRWRMIHLAEMLEEAKIPFTWTVFTDDISPMPEAFTLRRPRLDLTDHVGNADYLVQLSDTEGYAYSIAEALSIGTPVIVTDFPSAHEEGVIDGVNGWILPMSLEGVPLGKIYEGLPPFTYTPRPDRWGEILAPGESTYLEELATMRTIRCTERYFDIELQREVKEKELLTVRPERAELLISRNIAELYEEE